MPLSAVQNTFAGNPLDRASDRRADAAWLAERLRDPASVVIALRQGAPLVAGDPGAERLSRLPVSLAAELARRPGEDLLFLGLEDGRAVFALDVESAADPDFGPLAGRGRFEELRPLAMILPGGEAAIAATAKGVFEWQNRHRFCSACGQPSQGADGGWKRTCPSCRTDHFPRTDPVVIMLAVHNGRCLVGRNAAWPAGRFSALAGFLEPGETLEEACARELKEEAGLETLSVAYHSSQPWPYPSSLMIGLIAEVSSAQATPDQTELEEVRWLTREEAREVLAGRHEIQTPPPLAIAHQLLKSWAG
ncbi:MAG TPA: NAD(+) diphosphatase [Caulobacteraceae bacterium]|jgi:NAD+ diphosphatase